VAFKFWASQAAAIPWAVASVYLSLPWLRELAALTGRPLALAVIASVASIPGYLMAFTAASLLLDRQPPLRHRSPALPVTVLIAACNEAGRIPGTLRYIARQELQSSLDIAPERETWTPNACSPPGRSRGTLGSPYEPSTAGRDTGRLHPVRLPSGQRRVGEVGGGAASRSCPGPTRT
jgi:hypothetical protein